MRHSPAAIRRLLTQHAASGHTIAAFCGSHGLKIATFYAWKRKYGPPAAAAAAAAAATATTVSGGFCQLRPTAPTGAAWSLRLPSGLRLELSGLSPRELAHLLLELERGAHA